MQAKSNLVSTRNLHHINIIVVQTGKSIFVGSKIAAALNFAALFGRTLRTCLRPALISSFKLYHRPISEMVQDRTKVAIDHYSRN